MSERKDAEYWKTKYEEIERDYQDLQESSRMVEKELEGSLEQLENTLKEFKIKNNTLQFENDTLKERYNDLKSKDEEHISKLEEESAHCHKREEEYVKYIRELEQKNDDLERSQRAMITSLAEFETKLNSTLEKNVLLESELDEKESLKAMVQRLKDETRDLKQEMEVRDKCNDKSRIDSNKLDSSESPSAPIKSLNGLNNTRMSPATIVSELLRTVGVLESKLTVRLNQAESGSPSENGRDHLRRGRLNRGASSPSIHNLMRS